MTPDESPGEGPAFVPDDDSTVLGSEVTRDREGYWVELVVGFTDDVVRRRVGPYRTERMATVAATYIRRAAARQASPDPGSGREAGHGNEGNPAE
ncbi:MAG TPA: hypothetical protein VI248_21565 [Kineosporiaceae bacterium]